MKIAVVTIHRVHNYGSALQTYATQRVLEKLGHDVTVIDYITPQRTKRQLYAQPPAAAGCGGIKGKLLHGAKIASLMLRDISFGRFLKKHLKLTKQYITAEDMEKDPPAADLYVTGSDQVWNSVYNKGVDRGFFLDFIPEDCRRIAFVSSFGKDKLDEGEKEQTRRYLSRYEGLSVREDSARRILEDLGRTDAVQLIDPTLQLTKAEWLAMASGRLIREPYVLLFLLYNEDENATAYARRIADQRGIKVVKLSWEMKAPAGVDILMTHRRPEDFLSLFAHADFVVTNSFHGLAFSINLEKQFLVVPRKDFNSRIESLLRLTGLQSRMAGYGGVDIPQEEIDYVPVRRVLDAEREKAKGFLNAHMGQERR